MQATMLVSGNVPWGASRMASRNGYISPSTPLAKHSTTVTCANSAALKGYVSMLTSLNAHVDHSKPVAFSANGSHALYGVDATIDHTLPIHQPRAGFLTDYTNYGSLFDPIKSAYWYKWIAPGASVNAIAPDPEARPLVVDPTATSANTSAPANSSTSTPNTMPPAPVTPKSLKDMPDLDFPSVSRAKKRDLDPLTGNPGIFLPYNGVDPVSYLYYRGKWGDERYPKSDKRQKDLFGQFHKYEGGPTGPAWKGIDRKNVWPQGTGWVQPWLGP